MADPPTDRDPPPRAPLALGRDPVTGRPLHLLALPAPDGLPERLPWTAFTALVAWDVADRPIATVAAFVERLLDAGCVAVAAWGAGCSLVDDLVDEVQVARGLEGAPLESLAGLAEDEAFVMSTWHADETLEDAAEFALRLLVPSAPLARRARHFLALAVGPPDLGTALERALRSLAEDGG